MVGFLFLALCAGCIGRANSDVRATNNDSNNHNIASVEPFREPINENPDSGSSEAWIQIAEDRPGLCFVIDQRKLWEVGNYADDLGGQLSDSLEFKVNGEIVEIVEGPSAMLILLPVWSEEEGLLGSFSGPITACIESPKSHGANKIEAKVTNLSGVEFTNTWELTVP
jgi:hypothetical protein